MPTPGAISFEKGMRYKVLQELKTQTSTFLAGEIVEFKESAYGRYDGCTAFRFQSADTGEIKSWFLYDQDADVSATLFALTQNK